MAPPKDTHCSHCGSAFPPGAAYPKACGACGQTTWANPVPVAVVVVPCDGGVVCVRRGIEPGYGMLALPGGFMDLGETWQQSGAREVGEEIGVAIDPATVSVLDLPGVQPLVTARNGNLIVFMEVPPLAAVPAFSPDEETLEVVIVREPVELAFPAHTEVLAAFLRARS